MAWTTPRTWVTSEVVTASLMNTHVRDNFDETAPAAATASGGIIYSAGLNSIEERSPDQDFEATSEATSSSSYTDLATSGPAVTIATRARAMVVVSCRVTGATTGARASMSYAISGDTTVSANEQFGYQHEIDVASSFYSGSNVSFQTGMTTGDNTFTAKYASLGAGGSVTFSNRRIIVVPMN